MKSMKSMKSIPSKKPTFPELAANAALILIGAAWYSWGFFGALAFICIVALAFGWVYDRRQQRRAA